MENREKITKNNADYIFYIDGSIKNSKVAITDEYGITLHTAKNYKIEYQVEAEAYAFLALANYLKDEGIKDCKILIKADFVNYGSYKTKSKSGTYNWVAQKILKENNIKYCFDQIRSSENLADLETKIKDVFEPKNQYWTNSFKFEYRAFKNGKKVFTIKRWENARYRNYGGGYRVLEKIDASNREQVLDKTYQILENQDVSAKNRDQLKQIAKSDLENGINQYLN